MVELMSFVSGLKTSLKICGGNSANNRWMVGERQTGQGLRTVSSKRAESDCSKIDGCCLACHEIWKRGHVNCHPKTHL